MSAMERLPQRVLAPGMASGATWLHGSFLAVVASLDDPESRARVQVRLVNTDAADNQDAPLWARVATLFAGNDRGAFWMPDVDDEVLVTFVQGDPRLPVIVGGLWNGASAPPAQFESGRNKHKVVKTKNGITIAMHDEDGQEQLQIETPGGQKITLTDGPGKIEIEDSNGNSVKLETSGITVTASAKVTVNASQVAVSAGQVQVDAGMSSFSGVVRCDTLIATTVVATTYTPGAGNIW